VVARAAARELGEHGGAAGVEAALGELLAKAPGSAGELLAKAPGSA
jgi:hypothetical protein